MEPGELDPHASSATVAFDLESALERWRASFLAEGVSGQELEELEDHAREQHADLLGRGLTDEEAWLVASRRLGSGKALAREYAKVEDRLPPVLVWAAIGYLAFSSANSLLFLTGRSAFLLTERLWAGLGAEFVGCAALLWLITRLGLRGLARPGLSLVLLVGMRVVLATAEFYSSSWIAGAWLLGNRDSYLILGLAGSFSSVAILCGAVLLFTRRVLHRRPAEA